jgi:hypothetical protein
MIGHHAPGFHGQEGRTGSSRMASVTRQKAQTGYLARSLPSMQTAVVNTPKWYECSPYTTSNG